MQLFKVALRLVTLRLKESEATLPESTLFVKQIALLLQLGGRVVQLTPQLLVVVSSAHLVVLEGLGQMLVILTKVVDLSLIVGNELFAL